ncbi:transposase [Candidatus Curtissbacteria bacterium]|nr:transposase [Candidatus Curtissbacteria bacterium]
MPSKYVVREYEENAYYHVFNRGVEKRKIFLDEKDYKIFIYYLFIYLYPLERVLTKYPRLPIRLHNKNLSKEAALVSYCLMPNHFHLLLKQTTKSGISKFLKQITNAYTEYFNKKYVRSGSLMQGPFKAVRIKNDEQLIHITRYIHLNPYVAGLTEDLDSYQWSSYKDFIFKSDETFCETTVITDFFPSRTEYKKFIHDHADYAGGLKKIDNLIID